MLTSASFKKWALANVPIIYLTMRIWPHLTALTVALFRVVNMPFEPAEAAHMAVTELEPMGLQLF